MMWLGDLGIVWFSRFERTGEDWTYRIQLATIRDRSTKTNELFTSAVAGYTVLNNMARMMRFQPTTTIFGEFLSRSAFRIRLFEFYVGLGSEGLKMFDKLRLDCMWK